MTVPVFPSLIGLGYAVARRPLFKTQHQEAVSGQDNPIELWTYPRWAFELTFNVLRSDAVNLEWQTLAAFFLTQRGSSRVFQFTAPDDKAVTDQLFGTGDGATTAFALTRSLTGTGGVTFNEPVFAPTITNVKVSGTPTGAYTLGTQGLVTFTAAPANGAPLTWTGTYNWLCRFDDDAADFENFMSTFWRLGKIKFTTIKTQSK